MKLRLTLLLCFVAPVTLNLADDPKSIDRLDCVACIESKLPSQANTGKLCSAFLVNAGSRLYLVTAGHASAETNADSRLRYRDASGESQWVTLKSLIPPSSNPWHRDPTSDFAVAEIHPRDGNATYISHLTAISFPLESFCTDTPRRTTAIVTIGFPLMIGTRDGISPIAVTGHIASRDILADNSWGKEPIVFCIPALAQGTSGGPTLLLSEPQGSASVVGMYIGVVHDSSGGKLSKMVPAHLIRDCISGLISDSDGG